MFEMVVKNMRKNQHVTPHKDGGWQVKGSGNSSTTKITETQEEAITVARNIALNNKSELLIHNRKGRIRQKNSYGNDSFPPRG